MVKKTIKKITSRSTEETAEAPKEAVQPDQKVPKRRGCAFCEKKQLPSYTDMATLKRYISDRAKILPKEYTHLCAKHQRGLAKNIKYARHLALLPFTPKI